MIRILHFSDVHWGPENSKSIEIIRDAMIKDIKSLYTESEDCIDLVLFTGDLVLAGENGEHFSAAYKNLISPILRGINVPESQFVICPGNHDIDRAIVRGADFIEVGLKQSLNSVDSVNKFVDEIEEGKNFAPLALDRMKNYEKFVSELSWKPQISNGMVKIYRKKIGDIDIGIASFDNSWRSTGESGGIDRNNLILGERNVDFATSSMERADLAIGLFHHPTSWLAEFDAIAVSPRLHQGFDLLFYGHVHTTEPELKTTVNGTSILCQSGSFFAGRKYHNGYQILEVDPEICQVEVRLRTFFDAPARKFGPSENIVKDGTASFSYKPTRGRINPNLEKFLREIRPAIRCLALQQFNISGLGSELCSDFHSAFVCPPIFVRGNEGEKGNRRHKERTGFLGAEIKTRNLSVDLRDLLRSDNNFLFLGGRETGKTSIAHYASVLVAEGECDVSRVPIIADFRDFKGNLYSLKKLAASYIGISKAGFDLEKSLHDGEVIFLFDNYDSRLWSEKKSLEELVKKYPNTRWILLADARIGAAKAEDDGSDLVNSFKVVRIESLPRRSIRALTKSWCEKTGADGEQTFTTVMDQIRNSDLPRTGYIVTLLLWALQQEKKFERINESVLIMNMVDYLLGKADFTQALESEFDATSKEITLQSLSQFFKNNNDLVDPNCATEFLLDFFKTRGLNYDATKVLDSLCKCGILLRTPDSVKFKYRCFQEYFLARFIGSSDARFINSLHHRKYLEYSRELEILSGLERENDQLIDEIVFQVKNFLPSELTAIPLEKFEDLVEEELSVSISRTKLKKIVTTQVVNHGYFQMFKL